MAYASVVSGEERSPVEAAREVAVLVQESAEATERERRVSPDLVRSLARAGLFRLCLPRVLGGFEAHPETMIRTIEEIAVADGSAGWVVMIGATTGVIAAYLGEEEARQIYGSDPDVVTGGVFAPRGKATIDDQAYRVTGRWPFASGCEHCAWLMGGAIVLGEDGKPKPGPTGVPDARMMIFPASDATIHDTWDVSGLRGTGSHDIEVRELTVPAGRSVSLVSDRPRETGALYAFPVFGLLALGIAAVTTGIARRAIDELTRLAVAKMPTGSRRRLADREEIQARVGEAEAALRSARAYLFDAVGEAWQAAEEGGEMPLERRADIRLAASHAAWAAAGVVDAMYTAGGGTSVYAASPLQRCFRDAHVATQHVMVARPTFEVVGRVHLGIETDPSML